MEEVPFEDRHVPKVEIDWERSTWWWYPLTRAVHPAMRMFSLILSLFAVLIAQAGLALGRLMFDPKWLPSFVPDEITPYSWNLINRLPKMVTAMAEVEEIALNDIAFVTFELFWMAVTLSLLGGVIARRSAVELGQRTVAPWGESLRIVSSRWTSYLWSTGMHLVAIGAMLAPIVALGFLSRLGSVATAVACVLLMLCFPLVFGIGRFALSAVICFPLSVCGISFEKKADAFEGFSRANAYFFQRPVVAALCVTILILIGIIGEQIVFWTISSGWWLFGRSFITSAGGTSSTSLQYLSYGSWLASSLIGAYWFSYFWTASAATYLILRKSVDHTELDEIDCIVSAVEQSLPEIPATPPATESQESSNSSENAEEESTESGSDSESDENGQR